MGDSAIRLCAKCDDLKPLTEFYAGRGQCKTCVQERVRRYREADREADRERKRRYYEANRNAVRESQHRYRETRRDEARERSHAHYYGNRERQIAWQREYRASHRDEIRASASARYRGEKMRAWRLYFKHGMQPEDWAALWDDQLGRCYLCGDDLVEGTAVIDHDHGHCPAEQSCWVCRRGLACNNCNGTAGLANDDPARLRRLADALEAAQLEVARRQRSAPNAALHLAVIGTLFTIRGH